MKSAWFRLQFGLFTAVVLPIILTGQPVLSAAPTDEGAAPAVQRLNKLVESASFEQATTLARVLIAKYPDSAAVHLAYARLLRSSGQTDKAILEFKRASELDSSLAESRLALAQMSMENLEVESALRYAREVLKLQPNSEQARTVLINALIQSERLADAEQELAPLLSKPVNNAAALDLAAQLKEKKGDFKEARIYLERAVALKPERTDWTLELCKLLENSGDAGASRVYLAGLIKRHPEAIEPRLRLARNQEVFGHNYDEAIRLYAYVFMVDPTNAQALSSIPRCRAKKNNIALRLKLALQDWSKPSK